MWGSAIPVQNNLKSSWLEVLMIFLPECKSLARQAKFDKCWAPIAQWIYVTSFPSKLSLETYRHYQPAGGFSIDCRPWFCERCWFGTKRGGTWKWSAWRTKAHGVLEGKNKNKTCDENLTTIECSGSPIKPSFPQPGHPSRGNTTTRDIALAMATMLFQLVHCSFRKISLLALQEDYLHRLR